METINIENKPSWFKYLHKLNGSNWIKRLGNFKLKLNWTKLSVEHPNEIGDYYSYYTIRNAIFLELRESAEYKRLSRRIKQSKQSKSFYNSEYLKNKEYLKDRESIIDKNRVEWEIINCKNAVSSNKGLIKIYKKALLDLIRKRFEQENT